MKKLIIVGAGGFGREVAWLVERINKIKKTYEIIGFIDKNLVSGSKIGNYKVIGTEDVLNEFDSSTNICIAIGNAKLRKKVIEKIKKIKQFEFPNLIDPSAIIDESRIGKGNIICANNIFTVDYKIKDFCIINLACTIGHDVILDSYVTVYPGVNISGNTMINECVEIGTGSCIIQGKVINKNSIIGAGASVIRDIDEDIVAVGVPAKPKK